LHANSVDIDIHEVDGAVVDQIVVDAPADHAVDTIRGRWSAARRTAVDASMPDDFGPGHRGGVSLDVLPRLRQPATTDPSRRCREVVPADRRLSSRSNLDPGRGRFDPVGPSSAVVTVTSRPPCTFTAIVPRAGAYLAVFDALVAPADRALLVTGWHAPRWLRIVFLQRGSRGGGTSSPR